MKSSTANQLRVLFVDDEAPIREVMRIELPRMGHDATICDDGESAIEALQTTTFDAALVDLRMPGKTGWDVVEVIRETCPETDIVIITGHGNMTEAIQAIRCGAYDFLRKPCKLFEIANVLNRIAERRTLKNKTIALEKRLKQVEGTTELIGNSSEMTSVVTMIDRVAPTDSTVLILGETGTGKELVARRIHEASPRASMPFVPVNCGALPDNLVESEFFGHRKGAFTGAETARKGLIEVANGGTLFLDEIGDLGKPMQVKLLRFLESGEVRRVGENEPFQVDVRVVCATHRDLPDMVDDGSFREDLFFRINTFELFLPSLRERVDDLPELARYLISKHLKRPVDADIVSEEAIARLQRHNWTGNVRELRNVLEHAIILSGGETILEEHLPRSLDRRSAAAATPTIVSQTVDKTLREYEIDIIYQTLEKHDGDKTKTAAELGIALKTLYNKINSRQTQSSAG